MSAQYFAEGCFKYKVLTDLAHLPLKTPSTLIQVINHLLSAIFDLQLNRLNTHQ